MNMKIEAALRKARAYIAKDDGLITSQIIQQITKCEKPSEVELVVNWLEYFGDIEKIRNKKDIYKINNISRNMRWYLLAPKVLNLVNEKKMTLTKIAGISGISRGTLYNKILKREESMENMENEKSMVNEKSMEKENFELYEEQDKEVFELYKIRQTAKRKKKAISLTKNSLQVYIPMEYIDLKIYKSYDIYISNKKKARIVFYKTDVGAGKIRHDVQKETSTHLFSFKNIVSMWGITENGKYSCKVTKTSVTIDFNKKID